MEKILQTVNEKESQNQFRPSEMHLPLQDVAWWALSYLIQKSAGRLLSLFPNDDESSIIALFIREEYYSEIVVTRGPPVSPCKDQLLLNSNFIS